jgi:mRNA-degrading endonuclease RelE of RelBE toxin-antitoxin system
MAGLFKYREGNYRIIYEPLHKEKVIVIHEIGHRSEIYKKAKP